MSEQQYVHEQEMLDTTLHGTSNISDISQFTMT